MKKLHILLLGILLGSIPTAFATVVMFSDISSDSWYADAVNNLTELGIVQGYEDSTYKPSNNVNRAELAVMMDRLVDTIKNNTCVDGENIYFEGDEITEGDQAGCSCYDGEIKYCTGEDGPST